MIRKTGKLEQQISDFMDGELDQASSDRLINQARQYPSSYKTWQRYHLIGDAMRNQLPETLDIDLSERIKQSLEKEPTIFAPESANQTLTQANIDEHPAVVVAANQRSAYKVGLAMAATVAFAAVFGLQMLPLGQNFNAELPFAANNAGDSSGSDISVVSAPLSHPVEFQAAPVVRIDSFASLGEWKRLEQSPVVALPEMSPNQNLPGDVFGPANTGQARVVGFENQ